MGRKRGLILAVAGLLAWWAVSVTRSLMASRSRGGTEAPSSPAGDASVTTETHPPLAAPEGARQPAFALEKPTQGILPMERPFEFERELKSYQLLQTKVFLSEEEREERDRLLRNSGLLKALGQRLKEATRTPQGMEEQDAAVDLLVEALKSGDSTVAGEVLKEVIEDRQIENTSMERSAREQLAGLKAEVLYQWSAANPQMAGTLQSWLPGPVSHKIWANVMRMQQSNAADSAEEMQRSRH